MKIKNCCGNCEFHQLNLQDTKRVYCRRYPPIGFIVPQGQGRMGNMWAFPDIPRDWVCGEWKDGNAKVLGCLDTHT